MLKPPGTTFTARCFQDGANTSPPVLRDACRFSRGGLPPFLSSNNAPAPSLRRPSETRTLIVAATQTSDEGTPRRVCGVSPESSRAAKKKEAYQLVVLPKCLRRSTPLVRGTFFITPLLWNLPRSISSGSVVNVARKANGQTFVPPCSPHYRAGETEKEALRCFFSFSDKYFDVYMHGERRGAADCTVSISGHWWKNSHCY